MKLILIRGHPGSGKTTFARKLAEDNPYFIPMCADDFFIIDGEYQYDHNKIKRAHDRCYNRARLALTGYNTPVVHNTFTKLWELQKYLDLAREFNIPVEIYRMTGEFENVHGVPKEKVQQMKDRYEPHPDEIIQTVS